MTEADLDLHVVCPLVMKCYEGWMATPEKERGIQRLMGLRLLEELGLGFLAMGRDVDGKLWESNHNVGTFRYNWQYDL